MDGKSEQGLQRVAAYATIAGLPIALLALYLGWRQISPASAENAPTLTVAQLYAEFKRDECKTANATYMDRPVRIKGFVRGDVSLFPTEESRKAREAEIPADRTLVLGLDDSDIKNEPAGFGVIAAMAWQIRCFFPSSEAKKGVVQGQDVTIRGIYKGVIARSVIDQSMVLPPEKMGEKGPRIPHAAFKTQVVATRIENCQIER